MLYCGSANYYAIVYNSYIYHFINQLVFNKNQLAGKVLLCTHSSDFILVTAFNMKWLKHITPLLITAIAFVVILMNYLLSDDSAEVKSSISLIALPVIGGCVLADVIIKRVLKWKLLWIWITEILLLLIVAYLWIIAE